MSDTVIRVENLGKKYIIGHQQEGRSRYVALRDVIADGVKSLGYRFRHPFQSIVRTDKEEFWALRDVSFEVKQGEVVGVIGRNGAGKSTLLKLLSRITEPTTGRIHLKGRVASLLEVGTGFHPELTGRENIFLNGAILGMSRAEINKKFDEIVEFAEISRFLDTPVKRYSSGMYVRLAFSVAAHLEPEILVVDEVLAVGDASFQKKCLGKMDNVSKQDGRTVFFVSHNMGVINRLCNRCIWLHDGWMQSFSKTRPVVEKYLQFGNSIQPQVSFPSDPVKKFQFREIKLSNQLGDINFEIPDNEAIYILMELEAKEKIYDVYFGLTIQNSEGVNVLFADSRDVQNNFPENFKEGNHTISLLVPPCLTAGIYYISVGVATTSLQVYDYQESVCCFSIIGGFNSRRDQPRPGLINLHLPWRCKI
jgi:lipopolysaccharide transport system ATP-binding protein